MFSAKKVTFDQSSEEICETQEATDVDPNRPSVRVLAGSLVDLPLENQPPVLSVEKFGEKLEDLFDLELEEVGEVEQTKLEITASRGGELPEIDFEKQKQINSYFSSHLSIHMRNLGLKARENLKEKFKNAFKSISGSYLTGVPLKLSEQTKIDLIIPPRFKKLFEIYDHKLLLEVLFEVINNYKSVHRKKEVALQNSYYVIPTNPKSQLPLPKKKRNLLKQACRSNLLDRLRFSSFHPDEIDKSKDELRKVLRSGVSIPKAFYRYFNTYSKKEVMDTLLETIDNHRPTSSLVKSTARLEKSNSRAKPKRHKSKPATQRLAKKHMDDTNEALARDNSSQNEERIFILNNTSQDEVVSILTVSSEEDAGQEISISTAPRSNSPDLEKDEFRQAVDLSIMSSAPSVTPGELTSNLDFVDIEQIEFAPSGLNLPPTYSNEMTSKSKNMAVTSTEQNALVPIQSPLKSITPSSLVFHPSDKESEEDQNSDSSENTSSVELRERAARVPLRLIRSETPTLILNLFNAVWKEAKVNKSEAEELELPQTRP